MVKTLGIAVAVAAAVGLGPGPAFAWSCPTHVKAANEAIAKAEAAAAGITGDREKARALGMIEEAKELAKAAEAAHGAGNHARSEAKGKAAVWLAGQVH